MTPKVSPTVAHFPTDFPLSAADILTDCESFRCHVDTARHSPVDAVIAAVATAAECDPLELPSLSGVVDPDALDALVARKFTQSDAQETTVTFDYADYQVTVKAHGTIRIEQAAGEKDDGV